MSLRPQNYNALDEELSGLLCSPQASCCMLRLPVLLLGPSAFVPLFVFSLPCSIRNWQPPQHINNTQQKHISEHVRISHSEHLSAFAEKWHQVAFIPVQGSQCKPFHGSWCCWHFICTPNFKMELVRNAFYCMNDVCGAGRSCPGCLARLEGSL
jgi:hypothetical protein